MKCDLSLFAIFVTILFTLILPIGIDCCSNNQYDIISLMSQDPNFRQNPCYIQWKAEQDSKLEQLWKKRAELEASIARNDEIERENRRREDESRRNMYKNSWTTSTKKKQSSVWPILGIIFGVFVGICCCGVCLSWLDDDSTAPTTTPQNNLNPAGLTTVSITPSTTIDAPANQTTSTINANNNNINVIVTENRIPFSGDSNVPLLPRDVVNRQNSLPSYDDVMRMPSAPPKE